MPKAKSLEIVLISGSLRSHSVNGAVIATAARLAPRGVSALVYRRLQDLPHFNPDDDCEPLPESVAHLRETLRTAEAVMLSTPEYAGSLPGSFKNMLDWTVGGAGLYGKPVGWINPSAHGGSAETYRDLRTVLNRAGAEIVEPACVDIPTPRDAIGDDGIVAVAEIRNALQRAMTELAQAARLRRLTGEGAHGL